jgi:hypothetical protein
VHRRAHADAVDEEQHARTVAEFERARVAVVGLDRDLLHAGDATSYSP